MPRAKKKHTLKRKSLTSINKPKTKRIFFKYTVENLNNAIEDILSKTRGIREACRHYGIPRSTVQDRLSGRSKEQPRKVGPKPRFGVEGEKKIVDWIINMAKCGIPINKRTLIDTVEKIAKDMGISDSFTKGRPGITWYNGFLRRNPNISVREPESINKAREAVRENTIRKWFNDLEIFLDERGLSDIMNDPDRILNADETGVSLCPKTGKVLAPTGAKNVLIVKEGNEKETITVLVVMTASGKICPPNVVFPYVRAPKDVANNMPYGWVLGRSETGWMRSDTFYEYIANDFNKWLLEMCVKKPVILFVDGHRSHMSMPLSEFCEENQIILYALPPNTTHILQPADVSVFRPLKQDWQTTAKDWKDKTKQNITRSNFCKVFKQTLDKDMTVTIRNGFRKCGLYPFNVEQVDFTKCVKDAQENVKKRSLSSGGGLTEKDFGSALKVIQFLKENLLMKNIDTDVVCKEIKEAKKNFKPRPKSKTPRRSTSKTPRRSTSKTPRRSTSKTPRRSTSKTPRRSTSKTPRRSTSKTPRRSTPKTTRRSSTPKTHTSGVPQVSEVTPTDLSIPTVLDSVSDNPDDADSFSLLDVSIPEIGSFVSLNDISIMPMTMTDTSLIVTSVITDDQEICINQTQQIIDTENTTENTTKNKETIEKYTQEVETEIEDHVPEKLNTETETQENDPFKNHLRFPYEKSNIKIKNKNFKKYPSAISSQAWREFYTMKDKEQEKKIEAKNKRKAETEQKKNMSTNKKRKTKDKRNLKKGTKGILKDSNLSLELKSSDEETELNIGRIQKQTRKEANKTKDTKNGPQQEIETDKRIELTIESKEKIKEIENISTDDEEFNIFG